MHNKKIVMIISLCVSLFLITAGYAIYSSNLKITGTGSIDSNFNIEVTNIKEESKKGKAVSVTEPTYTSNTATFNTKLQRAGDNIEYLVEITNNGTIDGKINSITITNPSNIVKVDVRGIIEGEIIKSGEVKTYIVRVYIENDTKIEEDITSVIEVSAEIIQDDNQIFNNEIDGIEENKLEIESTKEESDYTSIIASINAKGNGLKYYYSLDGETWTGVTTSNTYTFTDLEVNTRYTVYYKVEDENLNYVTDSKWINTKDINETIIRVADENIWTTSKEVIIEYPEIEGLETYCKIGEEEYQLCNNLESITLTKNNTVYVKIIIDGKEEETYKEITKIDNDSPNLTLLSNSKSDQITIIANAIDESGILKYEYSIDGETWIDNGKYNNYTFKGLMHNTEYEIKVRVTDNIEHVTEMSTLVTTKYINMPIYKEISLGVVEITYPEGCGDEFVCTYIKDGTTEVSVSENIATVEFTANGVLVAKVTDGTNYITSSSYTIIVETETNFVYINDPERYYAVKDGYYKIETWGASGATSATSGGLGSYASGEIYLNEGNILYVYVGDEGTAGNTTSTFQGGGYNGGGNAIYSAGAGGGATDIRIGGTSLNDRIMVAGAGGGSGAFSANSYGGAGGDLIGVTGGHHSSSFQGGGTGGYQQYGGTLGNGTVAGTIGTFGTGGNGGYEESYAHGSGAGGGGYYGGAGGSARNGGGGGGSSYISGYAGVNSVISNSDNTHTSKTKHYSNYYFINTDMNSGINSGSGKAKITYIEKPSSEDSSKILSVRYIKDCIRGNSVDEGNAWVELQAINKGINLAKGKNVTALDKNNNIVTEGHSSNTSFSYAVDGMIDNFTVDLGYAAITESADSGTQCLIVDLGSEYDLEEIGVWHYYTDERIYYNNVTSVAGENEVYREIYNGEKEETTKGNHIKVDKLVPTFSEEKLNGTSNVTITYPTGCGSTYTCSYIKNNDEEVNVSTNTVVVDFIESGNLIAKVMRGTQYLASSSYTVSVIMEYEYEYTGENAIQTFKAEKTGYYKIETWGAEGGQFSTFVTGKGAYAAGTISLNEGEELYLTIGGQGSEALVSLDVTQGGYNGGGGTYYTAGTGGGATDIRFGGTSLNDRIMVAAGAGGTGTFSDREYGGSGGTLIGVDGGNYQCEQTESSSTATNCSGNHNGFGGTQTAGGTYGEYWSSGARENCLIGTAGAFGLGGIGGYEATYEQGSGGGGGGYYGGGGASERNGGGGGGSSYISGYAGVNSVTSTTDLTPTNQTKHYSGKYFIDTEMQAAVNSGNGKAKITYLGKTPKIEDSKNILSVRYIKDCIAGNEKNTSNHWIELQAINKGVNIANGKTVTSNFTISGNYGSGTYTTVVDGIMDDYSYVDDNASNSPGSSCIIVDLEKEFDLEEIAVWHYYKDGRIYTNNITSVAGADGVYREIYNDSHIETSSGNHIKNNSLDDISSLKPEFSVTGDVTMKTVTITYPEGCGRAITCSYSKDGASEVAVTSTTASVVFTDNGTITAKVTKGDNMISNSYEIEDIQAIILEISGYSQTGSFQVPSWCASTKPSYDTLYTFNITASGSLVSSGSMCYGSYCRNFSSSGSTGAGYGCFNGSAVWTYYNTSGQVDATVCNAVGTCKSTSIVGGS